MKKKISITLSQQSIERLKLIGNGNLSEGIEIASGSCRESKFRCSCCNRMKNEYVCFVPSSDDIDMGVCYQCLRVFKLSWSKDNREKIEKLFL